MDNEMYVDVKVSEETEDVNIKVKEEFNNNGGNGDYEKLKNLPYLDGEKIVGNMKERDPTVPDWAKQENKPTYTAEEVGALDEDSEMSYADIKSIWDATFNS
jgi:hypothetical protein